MLSPAHAIRTCPAGAVDGAVDGPVAGGAAAISNASVTDASILFRQAFIVHAFFRAFAASSKSFTARNASHPRAASVAIPRKTRKTCFTNGRNTL